jgi:cell wall-associated NlpC family hydrolase
MKWLLTITMALLLNGCVSSSAIASQLAKDEVTRSVETQQIVASKNIFNNPVISKSTSFAKYAESIENRKKLNKVVIRLIHRVGKTPYVPIGSSIYGWDCSGMVRWAYEQLGVEVPHSATAQAYVGERVSKKERKVGDIVIFGYRGSKSFYHSAIYIGKDKVVNANRGFGGTHIQPLSDYENNRIIYVRVIPTA